MQRARDYDPATAQFLTVDPALDVTHQPYAYVANNPLLLTDPLGLYSCDDYGKNALAFTFGLIDGLSFGASSLILGMVMPGYNEFTDNNAWFIGGIVVGSLAPAIATMGGSLAVSAVSIGARVLIRGATRAALSGGEHLAASATRTALVQTLEHAAGAGAREGLETGARTTARESAETAAQSCFVNSFTADTPVAMADGSTKRIADVELGDLVVATDPETGETAARPVTKLIRHSGGHEMADVELSDGAIIRATAEHPFWDATTSTFAYARDLAVGDEVMALDGTLLDVTAVVLHDQDLTAYNLQIDGIHTYYAGDTPVLVHNSCGPDVQALSDAGAAMNRNGFTDAGRALQKHSNRAGSSFPLPSGVRNPSAYNKLGQDVLNDLLTNPKTAIQTWHNPKQGLVTDFWLPFGGVQFNAKGVLIGFLEL